MGLRGRMTLKQSIIRKAFQDVYIRDYDHLEPVIQELLALRDKYMKPDHYRDRWELGYELMQYFQFEQSEGSELIFAFLKGIQEKNNLTTEEIIKLFKRL